MVILKRVVIITLISLIVITSTALSFVVFSMDFNDKNNEIASSTVCVESDVSIETEPYTEILEVLTTDSIENYYESNEITELEYNETYNTVEEPTKSTEYYTEDVYETENIDEDIEVTESEHNPNPNEYNDPPRKCFNFTDYEKWLFAQVVYLESGGESRECQMWVASVIVNRMITRNMTLSEVIYEPNQFHVIYSIGYCEPSDTTLSVVDQIEKEGSCLPLCVTYFGTGGYPCWYCTSPYGYINTSYFSCDTRLCYLEGGCSYVEEQDVEGD